MKDLNYRHKKNELGLENYFNKLSKFPILGLLLIGISAIVIRLIFFQNDIIFASDNLRYFTYAIDVSLTGKSLTASLPNDGWPLFLSIFFKFLDSKNFLDYMNLQSYLTIIFSTITIIPLYVLAKKFVRTSFALICTVLFVFEPRIIQNSLTGATDPLFILLIVTSLSLIVQKNKYIICSAFVTVSLASVVRVEGLFLIPALCLIFFLRFRITKKSFLQFIIFLSIAFLILLPFGIQRIENSGNDFLIGRIILESQSFSEKTQNDSNDIFLKIGESVYIFIGFLGKLMIPYLGIFVPIGIILFLKEKSIQKFLLIIPISFMILPSLYAFTVPALDSRYLFPILPILCIFGAYSCMKFYEKLKWKKEVIGIIFVIVIVSSGLFFDYKNNDIEKQKDFLKLSSEINKKTDVILYVNSPINPYLKAIQLLELKEFPITSSHWYNDEKTKTIKYDSIQDFFLEIKKNEITHIVFDENIDNPIILKQIFDNYDEYENLNKIFDSHDNGFNYKIEIFEIK